MSTALSPEPGAHLPPPWVMVLTACHPLLTPQSAVTLQRPLELRAHGAVS